MVVRLYDGPLMGINHARSAHAALNEARLVLAARPGRRRSSELVAQFETLVRSIFEDLNVVRERVASAECQRRAREGREPAQGLVGCRAEDSEAVARRATEIPTSFVAGAAGRPSRWHRSMISSSSSRPTDMIIASRPRQPLQSARTTMLSIAVGTVADRVDHRACILVLDEPADFRRGAGRRTRGGRQLRRRDHGPPQ